MPLLKMALLSFFGCIALSSAIIVTVVFTDVIPKKQQAAPVVKETVTLVEEDHSEEGIPEEEMEETPISSSEIPSESIESLIVGRWHHEFQKGVEPEPFRDLVFYPDGRLEERYVDVDRIADTLLWSLYYKDTEILVSRPGRKEAHINIKPTPLYSFKPSFSGKDIMFIDYGYHGSLDKRGVPEGHLVKYVRMPQ